MSTLLFDLANKIINESSFFNHEKCPFNAHFKNGNSNVLIITGENASGKSLFFQFMAGWAQRDGTTPITISIRERTGSGTYEGAAFRKSMMFGDETDTSTGTNSYKVVKKGFKTLKQYQSEGKISGLFLDEPEILSLIHI